MNKVGKHADGEWTLCLVRGDTGANEDALVQQRVDLSDKVSTVLCGENMACSNKELFSCC